MFRFLHAADIHLHSPLRGLTPYPGAPVDEIRAATQGAFENLIRLAIEEEVAFVLIAGDLYDQDWKDQNTGLFFTSQLSRLRQANIRVVLCYGNHDAASEITKRLKLPENAVALPPGRPKTIELEDLGVAIHGQSFAKRHVTDDVSASYPEPVTGLFNIGLLHTSATGRVGHDVYAPCSTESLRAKGYQYWALGHVHQREVLSEDPWIVFPGNTQGRHVRECGPKGCTLVTVEEDSVVSAEHCDLDVVRWCVCEIDAAGAEDSNDLIGRVGTAIVAELEKGEGRPLAIRLIVSGPCGAHAELGVDPERWKAEFRSVATDMSEGKVWIEKVQIRTRSEIDLAAIREREDALGGLLCSVMDAGQGDLADLSSEVTELIGRLPAEVRHGADGLDLNDPETAQRVLEDVREMLVARLLTTGENR